MARGRRNGVVTCGNQPAPSRRANMTDSATSEDQCHQKKLFVGGLGQNASIQTLRDYFRRYGDIVDTVVLRWPDGRPRGFGYVTFASAASASAVLQSGHNVGGCYVDVKRAVPGANKLFVGGLPHNASAIELRKHFEQFGLVSDAVVMMDPVTKRSRGFGFVFFSPDPDGSAAHAASLEQYDCHYIRGKWVEVKSAAPPRKLVSKEEGELSPQLVPEETCREDTTVSNLPHLDEASNGSRAKGKSWSRVPASSTCESSAAPVPLGLSVRTVAAVCSSGALPTASIDVPQPPGLDCVWPLVPRNFGQPQQNPMSQLGTLGLPDTALLPSLLGAVHQGYSTDAAYRCDAQSRPRAAMCDPMKIPIGSHFICEGSIPRDESTEFFDASTDLQRSLEQLLKMQCGQEHANIVPLAAVWGIDTGRGSIDQEEP